MQSKQLKDRTVVGKHGGPQKHKKKRREFSKIMAAIAITMWVFVNLFGMAMVIFTLDTSPLMYVIPSVDAVVAAIVVTDKLTTFAFVIFAVVKLPVVIFPVVILPVVIFAVVIVATELILAFGTFIIFVPGKSRSKFKIFEISAPLKL